MSTLSSDVWLLLAAFTLDLLLGDPRWLPHPIRGFGEAVARLESLWRPLGKRLGLRVAGVCFTATALAVGAGCVWVSLRLASANPWVLSLVTVYWIYSLLAVRDLDVESRLVVEALGRQDLAGAREKLGRIVGRDTGQLDEPEILRAVIETVGENLSDGIVAPLFYFAVAGPIGMAIYKAANTLDSMVGYRNDRYREFGWAAARLDDALNFVPARLSALLIWVSAGLLGLDVRRSVEAVFRDASLQPSPNAGFPEAALAGALRVRLGGLNYYQGRPSVKPPLGDAVVALSLSSYSRACRLLYLTAALGVFGAAVLLQWRNG